MTNFLQSPSSRLWLPGYEQTLDQDIHLVDDVADLLMVDVGGDCTDSEFNGMIELNHAASDFIDQKIDTGTYEDILEHHGIDPEWWIGRAEWLLGYELERV